MSEQAFKNIDDILRKEAGCTEQTSWLRDNSKKSFLGTPISVLAGQGSAHPAGDNRKGKTAIVENGVPGEKGIPGGNDVAGDSGVPGWHSRGYLPHFDNAEATQHVTFHLADSLPKDVLLRLDAELKNFPGETREAERRKRIAAWIDAGHGCCILRNAGIANLVQASLLFFDSRRYRLFAWIVMPNHVHVLFQPIHGWTVAKIVASWKKFTASNIYDHHQRTGEGPGSAVWHREYWDRYIRNAEHFCQAIDYIHQNPVKAGLVATPEQWPWSSAGNAIFHNGVGVPPFANTEIGVPGKA